MRKKRKMSKVQYLLCLAGLETVCINPGNVLILIWRNVSNLIYSPQLNSDWGCSSLDLNALSDCVSLNPPLLASNIWVSPWEGGGRREGALCWVLSVAVCALGSASWESSYSLMQRLVKYLGIISPELCCLRKWISERSISLRSAQTFAFTSEPSSLWEHCQALNQKLWIDLGWKGP